jgi:hypothetical protein
LVQWGRWEATLSCNKQQQLLQQQLGGHRRYSCLDLQRIRWGNGYSSSWRRKRAAGSLHRQIARQHSCRLQQQPLLLQQQLV